MGSARELAYLFDRATAAAADRTCANRADRRYPAVTERGDFGVGRFRSAERSRWLPGADARAMVERSEQAVEAPARAYGLGNRRGRALSHRRRKLRGDAGDGAPLGEDRADSDRRTARLVWKRGAGSGDAGGADAGRADSSDGGQRAVRNLRAGAERLSGGSDRQAGGDRGGIADGSEGGRVVLAARHDSGVGRDDRDARSGRESGRPELAHGGRSGGRIARRGSGR